MKRILAVLLCLLCTLFLLVACGDDSNTDTDGNQDNNTDNQGHTHTFKTNEEWSKDAQGHWYEATCDCEDVTVTKLNHTDANNDGACDVCTYTNHEHEYSEDWTADCTNHWNAADCGHTVAGINVAEHEDKDNDGKCDVCKYIIEDLHKHIYSTEWTSGDGYHWHDALCEHKLEVMDKAACTINDAGICTVCEARLKEIDKNDILAILKAAVANNYKVISGTVYAKEQAFEGTNVESGKVNDVYFVLGNGASYLKWGSYNKDNRFMGVDQYWFELLDDESIFGVQMPYYKPNDGTRNNNIEIFPVSGDADKLSGYNYLPGGILAAYDDTTTLAQTLFNLYDIMAIGANISDAKSSYDAETGKYTFSYNFFSVSETDGNTEQDGSGDAIISYYVEYYVVDAVFTVNDDYVVNFAEFNINSYRGLEGVDEDLTYDPVTNTVTLLEGADPTLYSYSVSQTSGKRDYTSIYSKEALLPIDFELSYVTGTDHTASGTIITSETPIVDIDGDGIIDLTVTKEEYVRLHLGNILPKSANPSFMDTKDFMATYINIEGNGSPWGSAEFYRAPAFDSYMNCITLRTENSGKYLITIKFGQVQKKISLTVAGEPEIVAPEDTDDTKYVIVTDANGWTDKYTFTAKESGTYTFTLPDGLGFVFENADIPEYDPFEPENEGNKKTFSFELAKDYSVTFFVGAQETGLYAISVAFEQGEVETPPEEVIDITGTYVSGQLTLVIDETKATFTYNGTDTVAVYEVKKGQVILYNNSDGTFSPSVLAITLTDGVVTGATLNGRKFTFKVEVIEPNGTTENPYIIEAAGEYTANFGGSEPVWFTYKADKSGWLTVSSDYAKAYLQIGTNLDALLDNKDSLDKYYSQTSAYVTAGQTVYIGVSDYALNAASVSFKVAFEENITEKQLALGDNVIYAKDEIYTYSVSKNTTLKITLKAPLDGTVTVTYSINGGESGTVAVGSEVDIEIKTGKKLTVTVSATDYATITVVDITGDQNNDELPDEEW